MRRSFPRSRLAAATAGASLVLAGAVGGIALSAPKGEDGVIHACFSRSNLDTDGSGQILLVNAGTPCPAGWPQELAWNAAGVAGAKGDPGTKGEKGDPGTKGDTVKPQLLTKEQQAAMLKQQKADEAKARQIGQSLDGIKEKLRDLDSGDQRDLILLYAQMNKWVTATDQLTTLTRRMSERQREIIQNAQ